MTLQQLKYFIVTANTGSISKAAERLYIAQPSLSNALRDLENETGRTLFSRTSKGTYLTHDGEEFLLYALQVVEQVSLLEERWVSKEPTNSRLHIISQHYAFAVKAFINMIKTCKVYEYDYRIQEGKIFDIIEEVRLLRCDIGLLYVGKYNRAVIEKLLREGNLEFNSLFTAELYVMISSTHPLAGKKFLTSNDLIDYPRTSFDQSDYNALVFSQYSGLKKDKLFSKTTEMVPKNISVGDKGTMLNLLLGINAYTLTTGMQGIDLYGDKVTTVPFCSEGTDLTVDVGWIARKDREKTAPLKRYIEELQIVAKECATAV